MNKEVIRNRLILLLAITFVILTVFGYAIENSMMFVICGFISILFIIRFISLILIFIRRTNKYNKQINTLKTKNNKTGFEMLLVDVLDKTYSKYFDAKNIILKSYDLNSIEVEVEYENINFSFTVNNSYIIYNDTKEIIMTATLDDIISEIKRKVTKIKEEIDFDLDNNFNDDVNRLNNKRLENFRAYNKFLKSNIYVATFVIAIFICFYIAFACEVKFNNRNNIFEIVLVSITFLFIITIMFMQIFSSATMLNRYNKLKRDISKNDISNITTNSKKVRIVTLQNKKSMHFVIGLKLYTNDKTFFVPMLKIESIKKIKNNKNLYDEINKMTHSFKYYTSSHVVISNNKCYEDIINKYVN